MTGSKGKGPARSFSQRRAIIVNEPKMKTTTIAFNLGPVSLNSPVVSSFKKGSHLVLFLETELGVVDQSERECALVARLEEEVSRIEMGGLQVQIAPAVAATVDRSHRPSFCLV